MREQIDPRERIGGTDFSRHAARAVEPVAEDRGSLAAGQIGEGTLPAGEDSTAMEHERQRRLNRWQEVR